MKAQATGTTPIEKAGEAFAAGTPGSRFVDVGPSSLVVLHGNLSVRIPKDQAAPIADMVAALIDDDHDDRAAAELVALRKASE